MAWILLSVRIDCPGLHVAVSASGTSPSSSDGTSQHHVPPSLPLPTPGVQSGSPAGENVSISYEQQNWSKVLPDNAASGVASSGTATTASSKASLTEGGDKGSHGEDTDTSAGRGRIIGSMFCPPPIEYRAEPRGTKRRASPPDPSRRASGSALDRIRITPVELLGKGRGHRLRTASGALPPAPLSWKRTGPDAKRAALGIA